MRILKGLFLIGAACMSLFARGAAKRPLEVVPSVDLNRYAGKWYEIARLPNWFQKNCASDTTATYKLNDGGKISVVNECRAADGSRKSAKGTARIASKTGPNTKLKVTFFWPFYGDYWILDLDPDYRWAVVGEPSRKYFWVLARDPHMEEALLAQIVARATAQGYDLGNLLRTKQS